MPSWNSMRWGDFSIASLIGGHKRPALLFSEQETTAPAQHFPHSDHVEGVESVEGVEGVEGVEKFLLDLSAAVCRGGFGDGLAEGGAAVGDAAEVEEGVVGEFFCRVEAVQAVLEGGAGSFPVRDREGDGLEVEKPRR